MSSFKVIKKLIVGCSLGLLFISTPASAFFGGGDCCEEPCCDGPLSVNSFGVLIKGGFTPTHFTHRGRVWLTNPDLDPPVFAGSGRTRFNNLFRTPWQVGAELQWNPCCNVQFFAEYVYERFDGKKRRFRAGQFDELDIRHRYRDIDTNAFYLGARYYFGNLFGGDCCGCSLFNNISPFVGFKGGFVWQNGSKYRVRIGEFDLGRFHYYKKQHAVSAGAQIGIDWAVTCNIGVVFTAEAVATQGFRPHRNHLLNPLFTNGVTNIGLGETGQLVSFPITLGLRYTF